MPQPSEVPRPFGNVEGEAPEPKKPTEEGGESAAPEKSATVSDFFQINEVFERVLATADEELTRPIRLLFWSGLAGGLVLGLSLLARAVMTAAAPEAPLVGNLLYPVGFIILILGRYQLFTENTLTPVTLLLTRLASLRDVLRIWGVVFAANLLGALVFAASLGPLQVLSPEAAEIATGFGRHLVEATTTAAFGKAVVAGWLLAVVVWLVHATRDSLSRIVIIWLLIYLQVTGELFHCIVGSLEVMFAIFAGQVSVAEYLTRFLAPVTLGNIVGGVVFVAVLNYVQIGDEDWFAERGERLSWRQWWGGRAKT